MRLSEETPALIRCPWSAVAFLNSPLMENSFRVETYLSIHELKLLVVGSRVEKFLKVLLMEEALVKLVC